MPSDWYSCLRPSLCGVILSNQQPLSTLDNWPLNQLLVCHNYHLWLSSSAGLRCCILCISRLLLARFIGWALCLSLATCGTYHLVRGFGWALRSSLATCHAYRMYVNHHMRTITKCVRGLTVCIFFWSLPECMLGSPLCVRWSPYGKCCIMGLFCWFPICTQLPNAFD